MKTLISILAAMLPAASPAQAAETSDAAAPAAKKELSASQQRMVDCNKDASGKKGDERKAFMRECMQADKPAAGTQQNRMKDCNKDAGDRKGADRKAFMSECLKKK